MQFPKKRTYLKSTGGAPGKSTTRSCCCRRSSEGRIADSASDVASALNDREASTAERQVYTRRMATIADDTDDNVIAERSSKIQEPVMEGQKLE